MERVIKQKVRVNTTYLASKRIVDIIGAVLGIVVLSPLFLFIVIS